MTPPRGTQLPPATEFFETIGYALITARSIQGFKLNRDNKPPGINQLQLGFEPGRGVRGGQSPGSFAIV
jgi:hypothetical protein